MGDWRSRFTTLGAEVDTTAWSPTPMHVRLGELRPSLVFALLGTTRARERASRRANLPEASYESVDFGLTILLLRAVVAAGLTPRFVYLSSLGVREATRNPYLRARVRVEQELRASGVPYTIVRPSFITGPDREAPRPLERGAAMIADALLGVAGALGARRLRDRYRSLTSSELADALVRAALDPSAENRVLEGDALRGE